MITKYYRRGPFFSRGILAATLLAGAAAVQADHTDKEKSKTAYGEKTSSAKHAKGATDTATCVQQAAKMNMATIRFGQLATEKAENPELKRFGRMLEQDHRKAQTELETLAKNHNVTLPTSLDDECEQEASRLQALNGREFDREFAKGAVEGHAMALAHLQQASTEAKDSDFRQYTQKMLTKVKDHQRQAREVARTVGVDAATITSLENKAHDSVGGPANRAESSTERSTDSADRK